MLGVCVRTALLLILYTLKENRTEDLRWRENVKCFVVAVVVDRRADSLLHVILNEFDSAF